MFAKTYGNGDKIEMRVSDIGRKVIATLNGVENPLLGSIVKLPKPAVVNGVEYTHVIGGQWALTAAEKMSIDAIYKEVVANGLAFERSVSQANVIRALRAGE